MDKEKILVDKEFLFKVLNQVDALTKRIGEMEIRPVQKLTYEEFVELYNKMVEINLRNVGIVLTSNGNKTP